MSETAIPAGAVVAFIGLGQMGLPMAARLVAAGFRIRGCDRSAQARAALAETGAEVFVTPREAADGAKTLITMLPDGAAVREVLIGPDGAAEALAAGALVVDMSSSAPLGTRELAEELSARGIDLIDAPVSGGRKRALDGTLAIMAGGETGPVERVRRLLLAMGSTVIATGPVGSGHAVKALNNYVSAAGLAAACEALLVAEKFGVDPEVLVDVLNVSTGRNNSTEVKLKPFILSGSYGSGFSMALMAKDLRTATDLACGLGVEVRGVKDAAALWAEASAALGPAADHTEIHRHLAARTTN